MEMDAMALYTGFPPNIAPYIWIAVGGALGAMGRYALGTVTVDSLGTGFPWGTFTVNLVGCLLIGLVMSQLGVLDSDGKNFVRFALVVGFLGSFTTLSTLSYEGLLMLQAKEHVQWVLYAGGSVFGGLLMVVAGMGIGKMIG